MSTIHTKASSNLNILFVIIYKFFLFFLVQCQSPRVLNSPVMAKKTPMVPSAPSHCHIAVVPPHLVVELERAQAPAVEIVRSPSSVPVITRCEISWFLTAATAFLNFDLKKKQNKYRCTPPPPQPQPASRRMYNATPLRIQVCAQPL